MLSTGLHFASESTHRPPRAAPVKQCSLSRNIQDSRSLELHPPLSRSADLSLGSPDSEWMGSAFQEYFRPGGRVPAAQGP